ncbi:MAG: DUF2911 domain-containing protein [Bacteroidota bacterium]
MNRIIITLLALVLGFSTAAFAQEFPGLDKSPADIAKFVQNGEVKIKVVYSRPQAKDREIYGNLVPTGKVWRTGANEATTITFYQDVKLGSTMIKAGEYALFSIYDGKQWTAVLNSQANQWGAYRMDPEKHVARFVAEIQDAPDFVEAFAIAFREVDGKAHMAMAWGDKMVEIPFTL